ncbi:S-adenosylmethionine-dependent methyltransferase NDAI_0B04730 [Naumovozyma dairenensis CBS 421]|uniref:Uncharacterized protein n=1 Tax=Naumovozyma dairenensis (strain ATCC 10597 / BCRC 20456 / CBS 421 / NBRC 0211 / NRRL Y-12639) TaxID=1071378 RepID=G0W6U7_NAUDC|nr:hypothetical protein NDAI_0B04730 [Naumovozyma dairenensis CBS 421]CCD23508.1 hypothetical protein NDAI_0B04730 [Naumovozyma dairenensis CBS 421]
MFDPLDLYSPDEQVQLEKITEATTIFTKLHQDDPVVVITAVNDNRIDGIKAQEEDEDEEEEDSIIDILDLPPATYATPQASLCVLLLLKPDKQVNFNTSNDDYDDSTNSKSVEIICKEKEISSELLSSLLTWYTDLWPNSRLNTELKICTRIPRLRSYGQKELLLNYYTSLLKKYDNCNEDYINDQIVKELSLRISENCGRSAQPSMTRDFNLQNLVHVIQLYEPSLTADNLGWKTWGSSLILSQELVNDLETNKNNKKSKSIRRVLELGAGTGLVGIAWACKWRQLYGNESIEMFVTDLPDIVTNLRKNVQNNDLDDFVVADVLDWTNPEDFIKKYSDEKFDTILIADPIYSPNHPEWVVNMICKFLAINGRCHLEIPLRAKYALEREKLSNLLEQHGLVVYNERSSEGMDDWGVVKYLYKEIGWDTTLTD